MKELTIEQKAQRYDEAFGMAKKWYDAPNINKIPTYGNRVIEEIFPELKESKSEDEKIRKELIAYCQVNMGHTWHDIKQEEYIAWLEKQGEKKPTDKVEPKTTEWSEEDERMYRGLYNLIYSTPYCDSREELSDWLKSLRPKKQWKPTEEQINIIDMILTDYAIDANVKSILKELKEQLKQL